MDKPFQRKGAESNTQVGRDFEAKAQVFFTQQGLHLTPRMAVEIGINGRKSQNFDLGDEHKGLGSRLYRLTENKLHLSLFSKVLAAYRRINMYQLQRH